VARTVLFWEDGFPFYNTLPVSQPILEAAFPRASFVALDELSSVLRNDQVSTLVLPYGSAFPFDAWSAIYQYLCHGGNLVTLGGAPFETPVYSDRQAFKPDRPTVAFQKRLHINQAWPVQTMRLQLRPAHPSIANIGGGWRARRCWSLMVRLSDEDHYARLGSMGVASAQIEPLVQAVSEDGRVLATPLVMLDHYHNQFAGGRWVMLNWEAEDGFNTSEEAVQLFSACQRLAEHGAIQFDARPAMATVSPGDRTELILHTRTWRTFSDASLHIRLTDPQDHVLLEQTLTLPLSNIPQHLTVSLPAATSPGLHRVHLRLRAGSRLLARDTTGFWCRDNKLLYESPALSAGEEFLQRDGHPMPVIGTTYMAHRVHRQFLLQPNAVSWDRDFAAMAEAGINLVRTGIWTGYEQLMKEPGIVREDMLRAFEAYLHAAIAHGIAVQFCFFAFQPEPFGSGNPYLDPEMRSRQKEFIAAFVRRFKDVPSLSWDLINEPSQFDPLHLFQQRPHYDEHERRAWNRWLQDRYSSYSALLAAWNATPEDVGQWGNVRLPRVNELSYQQRWQGGKPLIANDWHVFAQQAFADWVRDMVETIRSCESNQVVTVGQDEGAATGRPSPWFHHQWTDHTCVHTWWLNDAVLWDQLSASVPGQPLLVQETGIMQCEQLDEYSRRDEENRARLLERKFALALAAGAGFVQWLWNTNAHMNDDNEVAIGAVRADGSEKPEMRCTRLMAPFANVLESYAGASEPPPAIVVQPQSVLYSVMQPLAIAATQNAVRALAYDLGIQCRMFADGSLDLLDKAELLILPYPRAMSESAWQHLMNVVRRGATALISGPMGDAHFHHVNRLSKLGLQTEIRPVTAHTCQQESFGGPLILTYSGEKLNLVDRYIFENEPECTLRRIPLGNGQLILAAYPIELNDNFESIVQFYQSLVEKNGGEERYRAYTVSPWPLSGILVWRRAFRQAVLYACISESAQLHRLHIHDKEIDKTFTIDLEPERACLVLLERSSGRPLAAYIHGRLAIGHEEFWQKGNASLWWEDGQLRVRTLD